jgi:hypothetical protein
MKFEDNLSDAELNLLMDLVRCHVKAEQGESIFKTLLAMDVSSLGVDPGVSKIIAAGIADGIIQHGFMSGIYQLIVKTHPAVRNQSSPSEAQTIFPVPKKEALVAEVPWSPEDEVYQLFTWMLDTFVSYDDVQERWGPDKAKMLWRYFKLDRVAKYGFELIADTEADVERLMLQWRGNTTLPEGSDQD